MDGERRHQRKCNVNATSNDTVNVTADRGHGSDSFSVIGINYIDTEDTIKGTTKASIANGADKDAKITAATFKINANNNVTTKGFDGDRSAIDYYGGVIGIDGVSSTFNYSKQALVDVNGNVTTSGDQNYNAKLSGDITNKTYAQGGGVAATNSASSSNTLVSNNKIDVKSNSNITSNGDLTFTAGESVALNTAASTTTGGAIGVLFGTATNDVTRNNSLNVSGKVHSDKEINVEVGGNKDAIFDDKSNVAITSVAESINRTAIPASTSPNVKYNINNNNQISVSGTMDSGGDIKLTADSGYNKVDASSKSWTWTQGGESTEREISDSVIDGSFKGADNNAITVNGLVRAGNTIEDIDVSLSGRAVPSQANISGTTNSGNIDVTAPDGVTVTTSDIDYANVLGDRLLALNELITNYSMNDSTTAAYSAYVAERARVLELMEKLNLMDVETVNGQTIKTPITSGYTIKAAELSSINAPGGNLTLTTTALKGSGTLEAKAPPNVTINNTSNAYLKLNDINISGDGGGILFNGNAAKSGSGGVASTLKINSNENNPGNITVINNADTSSIQVVSKTDSSQTATYVPRGAVDIAGNLDAGNGNVTITNNTGDIDVATTGSITGSNVQLVSSNTINQGYTAGIVNIGGDPESMSAVQTQQTALDGGVAAQPRTSDSYWISPPYGSEDPRVTAGTNTGRIAGDNIYIAASDINVNGVIQSGYDTYKATITQSDLVNALINISTRSKDSNGNYIISSGGATYNSSKGYYDFIVPISYDLVHNRLLVDDINTSGGKIYLSGRISSTGNGRIYAASGEADIRIVNNTDSPIEFGTINNNARDGKITISDSGKDTWTEYTPGQTRTIENYSAALSTYKGDVQDHATITTNNLSASKGTISYKPSDLVYGWTRGVTTQTVQSYYRETETGGWWDLYDAGSSSSMSEYESSHPATPQTLSEYSIPTGSFIQRQRDDLWEFSIRSNASDTATTPMMELLSQVRVTSEPTRTNYSSWTSRHGFLGWYKTYHYSWQVKSGNLKVYTYGLEADMPITVGFIGENTGSTSVNSSGDIYFTDDMSMAKSGEVFTAKSTGSIKQTSGARLTADEVSLTASKDISGINISTIGGTVELDAKSNNGGAIDADVNGNLQLLWATTTGDLTLTATGNIISDSQEVSGANVELNSSGGDITVGNTRFWARGGLTATKSLTASAAGDVAIISATDLPIRQVTSGGSVSLEAVKNQGDSSLRYGGKVYQVDVNDASEVDETTKIHAWIDAGLIAPTDDYEGEYIASLNKDVTDYEAKIGDEYSSYIAGKSDYDAFKSNVAAEYAAYQSGKEEFAALSSEVASEYSTYNLILNRLNFSRIQSEYRRYLELEANVVTRYLNYSEYKRLAAAYGNYNSVWDYVAAQLSGSDLTLFNKYRGTLYAAEYLLKTDSGKLNAKYSTYDSVDAYLAANSSMYNLDAKYGDYDTLAAYLATDSAYQTLVDRRDNPEFSTTLEELLNAEKSVDPASKYKITAETIKINNVTIK